MRFLIFISFLYSAPVWSQQVYISKNQKLSAEMVGYDILGSGTSGELYIYKKYRFEDEVDIYDKEMNLKRTKNITLKGVNYETNEVIKLGDHIYQFYTEKSGKVSYMKYQKYSLGMEAKGDPLVIDSTVSKIGEAYSEFNIIRSELEEYVLVYKYGYENGRIQQTYLQIINKEGKVIVESKFSLPTQQFSGNPDGVSISNNGRPVFLFQNTDYSCRKDKSDISYWFAFPGPGNTLSSTLLNNIDSFCIKEMNFGLDQQHGEVLAAGYYGDDNRYNMNGYFTMHIDMSSGAVMEANHQAFSDELRSSITSMLDKTSRFTPAYQVTKIVPRMDGGALIVGEYYDKTIENYDYTNYDPYYGYRTSTRQLEFYEYNDILLLSVDATGAMDWSNIIRKKQQSKEDRGVSSSFGLLNSQRFMYFIFNEDITQNSNVLMYALSADGTLDRQSLFNPSKQEVELRPASGKQIAYDEVVIPSIYKRNLAFIKIKL